MTRATIHHIDIEPFELTPEQVAGLLRAREMGGAPVTINIDVNQVEAGETNKISLSFMIEEEELINSIANVKDKVELDPRQVEKELELINSFDSDDGKRGEDRRLNMAFILKAVRESPFPLHKEEIMSRLGFHISESSVKRHLAILLGEDLITKTGENRDTKYWRPEHE